MRGRLSRAFDTYRGRLMRICAEDSTFFDTNIVIGTHREQNLRINNLSKFKITGFKIALVDISNDQNRKIIAKSERKLQIRVSMEMDQTFYSPGFSVIH